MTTEDRTSILTKVDGLVRAKYFDPKFNGRDWPHLVAVHRDRIVGAIDDDVFEREMNALLDKLGTSHTAFFGPKTPIPSRSSINATFRAVPTEDGERWAFQDVQPGGPADRAGIQPGDLLVAVDNRELMPPGIPEFQMRESTQVSVIPKNGNLNRLNLVVKTSKPKYEDSPYSEPRAVIPKIMEGGTGYLKVAIFPGVIGIDFARDVDQAMSELRNCERLIIDLRGNPGGGIGGLRLMSYLTPGKVPVGYSLTRKRAEQGYRKEDLPQFRGIPDSKWELPRLALRFVGRDKSIVVVTEGLGKQRYHGRIALLVNEHTAGAAEMVAGFAQENGLGKVVGVKTAGRLSGGRASNVGHGYRVMLPIGAYVSWQGNRWEGRGVEPDLASEWSIETAREGYDPVLTEASRMLDNSR